MHRNLLGIVALGLTVSGAIGLLAGYHANSQAGMAAGVGMRAGLVLGALWMALPQLTNMLQVVPSWLIGLVAIGGLAVVVYPKSFFLVGFAVAVLVGLQFVGRFLKPSTSKRKGSPARTKRPAAKKRPPDASRERSE